MERRRDGGTERTRDANDSLHLSVSPSLRLSHSDYPLNPGRECIIIFRFHFLQSGSPFVVEENYPHGSVSRP